uniref:Uncharacterized protein n=1 Tax=Cucumis sativus TaxID=3659 RepID=A0A0A0KD08_CUCSA
MYTAVLLAVIPFLLWLLKNANHLLYETAQLGSKRFALPPGNLGWPFIGNMWSFLRAFKSPYPDSFMDSFLSRYGNTGMYKAFMFGSPSVIVTSAEACKRVLNDDEAFGSGWPPSTMKLIGENSFIGISNQEHKRLRRITAAPVNGYDALATYLTYIEKIVVSSLDKWGNMGEIEFLTELRKLTFKIIMYIFLSSESETIMEALEREYTMLNLGVRAMAINIPGFAYYKALKARKNLEATFGSIVRGRRMERERKENSKTMKRDMLDALLEAEDEDGRRLSDEEIIDVLIMYLNAGHESSGHTMMWATIFLQQHPHFLQKAKAEQEEMIKKRPVGQKGLTLKEVRQMPYLSKVIDETLRVVTFSLTVFREAKHDVKISAYKLSNSLLSFLFNDFIPKAGSFLPFGAGSRLCPGNDLAKLEISVFLHYFLLNYKLERVNPESPIRYLPHSKPEDNCLGRIKRLV